MKSKKHKNKTHTYIPVHTALTIATSRLPQTPKKKKNISIHTYHMHNISTVISVQKNVHFVVSKLKSL